MATPRWRWVAAMLLVLAALAAPAPSSAAPLEFASGNAFQYVYNPGPSNGGQQQYVNDHTFFRGPDGTWHLFGIIGNQAPPGSGPDSNLERVFVHATAPSLTGPWTTQAPVLPYDPSYGETHVWAPHVTTDGSGTYFMFYAGGGSDPSHAEINLATSTDLYHWTREPTGPVFRDGFEARDPYVTRIGDQWVMYYEATSAPTGGNYVVAYRTSQDLRHWSARNIAFTDPTSGTGAGNTESPTVVQHNGTWYLFIGPRQGYSGTDVYRSDNPLNFSIANSAGHIWSHAAEVVQDGSNWWVSAAGWFQRGVSLSPLTWSTSAPPPFANYSATPDDFSDGHGNPVVGRQKNGAMVVFAIAPDRSYISYRAQAAPSSGWGPWTKLGGPVGGLPVVAANADGRLELFILGPDSQNIAHIWQTAPNGGWSGWDTSFGGPAGALAVSRNADGRLELFATGPKDGAGNSAYVSHRWQTAANGNWSGWDADGLGTFAGPVSGTPVIAHEANGRMIVFAYGPNHASVATREQLAPSSGWGTWNPGFAGPTSALSVGRNADGRVEVFAAGPADASGNSSFVARRSQTAPNAGWGSWDNSFAGPVHGAPSVGRQADGRLAVFALGPNGNSVQEREQLFPTGPWAPWNPGFGLAAATVNPSINADGRMETFALAPGGSNISHIWQTSADGAWSGWNTDGVFGGPAG